MKIKVLFQLCLFSFCFIPFLSSQNSTKYFRKFTIDSRFCNVELKCPVENLLSGKISCYLASYDTKGRIQTVTFLDKGKPAIDFTGFTKFIIEYSDSTEKRTFFNKFDKPTVNRDGIYSYSLKLNKTNYPVQLINYDQSGEISTDKNGVSIYQYTLDGLNRVVKVHFLNKKSDSIVNLKGYFYMTYDWKEDELSYIVELSYFDKSGRLKEDTNGIAVCRSSYDKISKELIGQSYYGADRKMKESKQLKVAKFIAKYDSNGYETERRFYGTDGKLKETNQGFSIIRQKYNAFGKVIEKRFYGNDAKLIGKKNIGYIKYGFSIIKYEYDDSANITKVSYYGYDENLKNDNSGVAIRVYKYDDRNRKTEESLYDVHNQLLVTGVCMVNWKYDEFDNVVEESHWGADNQLIESENRIAIIRWLYNVEGNATHTRYFDSKGNLISEN